MQCTFAFFASALCTLQEHQTQEDRTLANLGRPYPRARLRSLGRLPVTARFTVSLPFSAQRFIAAGLKRFWRSARVIFFLLSPSPLDRPFLFSHGCLLPDHY
uniref:Uncharacterized protein n=1 Tax=Arundo donax TaxID=35708 RepID=A0A0A9VJE6_ARUDO